MDRIYRLKKMRVSLYESDPYVMFPDDARIITGKYCNVFVDGEPNCVTEGIEIIYLMLDQKEEK